MKRLKGNGGFTLALAVMALVFFLIGLGYNPRARAIPLVLASLLFFLAMLIFFAENVPGATKRLKFMEQRGFFTNQGPKREEGKGEAMPQVREGAKLLRLLLWLCGFLLLLRYVSYLITVPLWLVLFVKFEGGRSWQNAVFLALGMGLFDYVLFAVLLRASL